jgi:hypothetical protein
MLMIETWTGETAAALQRAMRLTNEAFANHLGIAVRTVANWHARPGIVPSSDLQQVLDTVQDQCSDEVRARFSHFAHLGSHREPENFPAAAGWSLEPEILDTTDWLDERAGLAFGTSEKAVEARLGGLDRHAIRILANQRTKVGRSQLAGVIAALYGSSASDLQLYCAAIDGVILQTTMLVRPDWLRSGLSLSAGQDQFQIQDPTSDSQPLDEVAHARAVQRLAEIVASGTHFFDAPLYRLREVALSETAIRGRFALSSFREYALTTDLVSIELLDALADGPNVAWEALPGRSRYLPNIEAAADLPNRGPGGGVLSLFAAARPADRSGRPPDYLILVQERSRQVLNANAQLAVIPKAFHQPMASFTDDAHLAATLTRELEEELFGREELELGGQGVADPTHPKRLSEPMHWLIDHDDPRTWQMDCTGFGINLLSGNYEFSALTAIHDETWWTEYGGQVMANWEASRLQQFSSRDTTALHRLICDDRWSNEGLFALLRGLQRLAKIAPDRTNIPEIIEEL